MPTPTPDVLKAGTTASRDLQIDSIQVRVVDEAARTVELAFSSEAPVERWWGVEVLDHSSKSVNLDRLKRGGALLMDHDRRDHVGVIESVRIDSDRVGRAVVRFGKSARASEVYQDVIDGIRTNVSVGYAIEDVVLESEKDGVPTYRIKSWTPFEISLVSIPADMSVGVGRGADEPAPSEPATPPAVASAPAPAPHIASPGARTMTDSTPTAVDTTAITNEAQRSGQSDERRRVAEILAIGEGFARFGVDKLAADAVRNGMTVDAFRAKAMEAMANTPTATADIGMSRAETQRYSLLRALNHLANPNDKRARDAAAFERECSEAAASRNGKSPQGLIVPFDVLKRDLTVGAPTAGGNLVSTDLQSASFIELLRNAMVIQRLGAQVLTGLTGKLSIPRQTGAAQAYWLAEGGAPTESQQAIGQVPLAAKTVGAYTDVSRQLLIQSSIDVENFVQGDLARVLGLAIQAAAISGGGANEPTGILATAGIGSVVGGTDGGAPTWAHIVELETDVSVANADVGTLAYLTNAKVRGKLKTTEKFAGTNGNPVWADGATPLNGYQAAVTNAVPSNLTKGLAAGTCSAIVFGNFADLIIGMWSGLDLMVDPYSLSTSGAVRVVALQDVDVAIRHAESFSAMLDALTA
jgi:HK97 family phage major capsid protein/HK97 family phage prohead protease